MAVVMYMRWTGVTPEQYDAAREIVDWEGETPEGALFHAAAFDDDGLRVFDMWESGEAFQRFVDERLKAGVEEVGIEGDPEVEIYEIHRTFTPAFEPAAS
jgi:hypothetical protein